MDLQALLGTSEFVPLLFLVSEVLSKSKPVLKSSHEPHLVLYMQTDLTESSRKDSFQNLPSKP